MRNLLCLNAVDIVDRRRRGKPSSRHGLTKCANAVNRRPALRPVHQSTRKRHTIAGKKAAFSVDPNTGRKFVDPREGETWHTA
jgi:hypothetical protein